MFDKRIGSILYNYYNKIFGRSDNDENTSQYRLKDIWHLQLHSRSNMTAEGEVDTFQAPNSNRCSDGWFGWLRWKPTSSQLLIKAEENMLSVVKNVYEKKFVPLKSGEKLWTLLFNKQVETETPLVLVHGFAGGVGLWALNLDELSKSRPVYAFDLLGFGRSSHPRFDKEPEKIESTFVDSIEEWREAMNIDRMILLGHSFGGYLVSSYALRYPERIKHLILADPWGFPEYHSETTRTLPIWIKMVAKLLSPFNPLAAVRAAGPLGPRLIQRARGDLGAKFPGCEDGETSAVFDYIYHCNAQTPSGEAGFKNITVKIGFAAKPMMDRIGDMKAGMPISFIYGARTWMDIKCGHRTQEMLPDNEVAVYSVKSAGHHVYADQPEDFNQIVNTICDSID